MIVCGELGCFFTLRCLERQLSRRGSGERNWGRRGMERKKKGGGGETGEGEEVRREMRYKDFYE